MKPLFVLLFFGCSLLSAQKTIQLQENQSSPPATLEEVSWIAGHWQGEAFGGIAEEIWSPPLGESMMFVFRLVNDDKVSFYEVGYIKEVENTLILQLKHFHGDLKGWEEKDETIDFKLVKIEEGKVYFEGLTMQKVGENQLKVYVLIDEGDQANEVLFEYYRFKE